MSSDRQRRRAEARAAKKALPVIGGAYASSDQSEGSKPTVMNLVWLIVGLVTGSIIVYLFSGPFGKADPTPMVSGSFDPLNVTLGQLTEMPEEQLARIDLGLVNLICSQGLPGRNNQTLAEGMHYLERMTASVRKQTAQNLHRFLEHPAEFENSEAFYKVLMLNTVLGQDFGVHYNESKVAEASAASIRDQTFYSNADDIFLSGLLGSGRHEGTCASMPVLLAAVGRQLGYPLKLVPAKAHLFLRWEDSKERRNFECTNGITCPTDEHFKNWPFPISDEDIKAGIYLSPMNRRQELAAFLALRASVLAVNGHDTESLLAITQASLLYPTEPNYQVQFQQVCGKNVYQSPFSGYPLPASAPIPNDPIANTFDVDAFNRMNRARTDSGFRRYSPPPPLPPPFFNH